ncbi:MAG TPA: branched-chain-amino-acid transaminase [bacterium]|jgi:branched-chain amino acid aminotransferase|nr:branched-chain-amino-acid transaminase [bacterium]HOP55386.1 branched-chain-amino-acid transaminase [bacterium]HRR92297.1 branched-chain-amino-acid transaminase [bacterium]
MGIVYVNGEFVSTEEAKVSVYDRGLLYGDGVFEGIRAYNGRVFKLDEHIDRLYESAHSILIDIPLTKEEFKENLAETIRRNQLRDSYIRPIVTRGIKGLGIDPWDAMSPTVIIIADKINLYSSKMYEEGISAVCASTIRNNPNACNPQIKSLNYLNSALAKFEAYLAGADEALFLNPQGYVVEAAVDNLFIYTKEGVLITPPTYLGALRGITRDAVIAIARDKGIPVKEEPFTRHSLYNAVESFLTGTAAEIIPLVKVDGRVIGDGRPGKVTRDIMAAYRELTKTSGYPVY